jgi:hypothetical protein
MFLKVSRLIVCTSVLFSLGSRGLCAFETDSPAPLAQQGSSVSASVTPTPLPLRISNGTTTILISPQGNYTVNKRILEHNSSANIPNGSLRIRDNEGIITSSATMSANNVKGVVGAGTTNPAPEGTLKFRNTAQPLTGDVSQAYFETSQESGDIMIAGTKNQEGVHTFAVAYVDNYGVFEQYAENGDFEFAYSNIGAEGKELKDEAGDPTYFYYIKDHLGSTRVIIDEQMEPSGVYAYAAYGKEKELNAS